MRAPFKKQRRSGSYLDLYGNFLNYASPFSRITIEGHGERCDCESLGAVEFRMSNLYATSPHGQVSGLVPLHTMAQSHMHLEIIERRFGCPKLYTPYVRDQSLVVQGFPDDEWTTGRAVFPPITDCKKAALSAFMLLDISCPTPG